MKTLEKEWQKSLYWSFSYVKNPNICATFQSINRNKVPRSKLLSISKDFRLKNWIFHL